MRVGYLRVTHPCAALQRIATFLARLACVRHAASVRSEPGSNSLIKKCLNSWPVSREHTTPLRVGFPGIPNSMSQSDQGFKEPWPPTTKSCHQRQDGLAIQFSKTGCPNRRRLPPNHPGKGSRRGRDNVCIPPHSQAASRKFFLCLSIRNYYDFRQPPKSPKNSFFAPHSEPPGTRAPTIAVP